MTTPPSPHLAIDGRDSSGGARSSDTFPPSSARSSRLGSISVSHQRRSPSPLPRSESNPSDSPSVMNKIVANIGGGFKGIKKAFAKKEASSTEESGAPASRMDAMVNEKMPKGFNRVLAQIKTKPNLKKGATVADLRLSHHHHHHHHSSLSFRNIPSFPDLTDAEKQQQRRESGGSLIELGGEGGVIETDGPVDSEQRQAAIFHLRDKIWKTEEAIRREQGIMDDHLKEFLKLDTVEVNRKPKLKSVFETRNNKSKQTIDNFKKKIEKYKAKIKTLEQGGGDMTVLKGRMIEGWRGVKEGILDTLSGAANLMRRSGRHPAAHEGVSGGGDSNSLMEMEIGERPQKLVGGSEENVERTFHVGDVEAVSGISLIMPTVEELKERVRELDEAYSETVKRLDELKEIHALKQRESEEKNFEDLRRAREEREEMQIRLEKEILLRETVESQCHDLEVSHQDLQSELSQLQERLGVLEYHTGEHFAETDERVGSLDLKLSELQHDRERHNEGLLLTQSSPTYKRALVAKPLSFLLNIVSGLIAIISGILLPLRVYQQQGKWRWAWLFATFVILILILVYF
ncbi:transmembrane and coiled-coil domains protein 2-like [Oscarella lobularis]|uniref:transmembrane and coiled-coil domains protein 2-like n=1 Tax=Oscarella lobularis TaxID=121494 RepID=UPI003313F56F